MMGKEGELLPSCYISPGWDFQHDKQRVGNNLDGGEWGGGGQSGEPGGSVRRKSSGKAFHTNPSLNSPRSYCKHSAGRLERSSSGGGGGCGGGGGGGGG